MPDTQYKMLDVGLSLQFNDDAHSGGVTTTLDDSDEKLGTVFQCPADCVINGGAVMVGTRTGTCPTFKLKLQGVDASGMPDGSTKTGCENYFQPSEDNARAAVTFGGTYNASQGELLAIVCDHYSGTINSSNKCTFYSGYKYAGGCTTPYRVTANSSGVWASGYVYAPTTTCTTTSDFDVGGVMYHDRATYSLSTSGHRYACKFKLPETAGTRFYLAGFDWFGENNSATGEEFKVAVWSESGAQFDQTIDTDQESGTTSYSRWRRYIFTGYSISNYLTYGTTYYIGFENTGDNFTPQYIDVKHADSLRSWPLGSNVHGASYDGASWTDHTTHRPLIKLLLSDEQNPKSEIVNVLRRVR